MKLIDVFPDSIATDWQLGGYELMVAHEILRGRYRKSFTAPEAARPRIRRSTSRSTFTSRATRSSAGTG